MSLPEADWLAFCRRAGTAARDAVASYSTRAERSVETGVGEGGDMSYVIDRAAEDAIFAELEGLDVPVTAVSEERGEVPIAGGGPARVVIDPVDGSLNAKRGVPFSAVSIAVASGAAWATWRSGGWPSWLLPGPRAASRAWPGIGGRCGARERVWRRERSPGSSPGPRDPRPGDRSPAAAPARRLLSPSSRHAGSARWARWP